MTQQAGLTLIEGVQAARSSMSNLLYCQALEDIEQQLKQGDTLYHALAQHTLFTPLCHQLVRVGEESGTLDTLFDKLALWHEQHTFELADALAQSLETALMMIIGCIVDLFTVALYMPIFQLSDVLK